LGFALLFFIGFPLAAEETVNTNFPDAFKEKEKGWPNYSFEPHLNIGFSF